MKLGFFLFAYPVLSETFVINELWQLQQTGVRGVIWHEQRGDGAAHPKVGRIEFPIFQLPAKIWGAATLNLLTAHLWWLGHRPFQYLALLAEVWRHFPDWESGKIWIKAAAVARQVAESGVELIYVHESDRAYLFGLCAARLCRLPVVIIFHTYYLFVRGQYLAAKLQTADGVIFQSGYSRQFALAKGGKQYAGKCWVISSPGIDTAFFHPPPARQLTPLRHARGRLRIVSVGRLAEAKGYEYLIRAVALLRRRRVAVECRIVGEGPLRPELEALIKRLGVQRQVRLLGAVPHTAVLQQILQWGEYFVLPSVQDREGVHDVHPNALKEAMAAGLIVLTTRLGGMTEVLTDGVEGFILARADHRLIAQRLQVLQRQPAAVRQAVSRQARQRILAEFSAGMITAQLRDCLHTYVTADTPPTP